MAKIYTMKDADLSILKGKKIAVIGYGSQGHAQAQNLHDNGFDVVVGLREGSKTFDVVKADGLVPLTIKEACEQADYIHLLIPDENHKAVYEEFVKPNLTAGKSLVVSHGFSLHYGLVTPPKDVDVFLCAPKGPGHLVRRMFKEGKGVPGLVAVYQDATGTAFAKSLAYSFGIGTLPAGCVETTIQEETETDLFGEQAVLCGGTVELIKAGFETLVEAGYQPEIAYYEVCHELKLIVDLINEGGLERMRFSVSDTAEYGDYVSGPRVISDASKQAMKDVLADIKSGKFAKAWIKENEDGRPWFSKKRASEKELLIEKVGKELRANMAWNQNK